MPYVVKFTESERGWGSEVWYRGYNTREEALSAESDCNKKLPTSYVPDYYIQAEYKGAMEEIP